MPFDTGPHVQIAALCEKVLQEKDGVLSLIRIVDRIFFQTNAPNAPEKMPPVPIIVTAVVSLKADQARGSHELKIRPEAPSGLKMPDISAPVLMEGEERGFNFVTQIGFQAEQEGLYWFDVLFDNNLLTRMPLRVVYQRLSSGHILPGPPS